MKSDQRHPVERALELLVFGPLGAGLYLKDAAPSLIEMFVARGRAELERRQEDVARHVTTARSLGQVSLAFGLPKVRNHVGNRMGEARDLAAGWLGTVTRAPAAPPPAPATRAAPSRAPAAPAAHVVSGNGATSSAPAGPASSELPIPGYDALSASQVVERLTGLSSAELDIVRAYEAGHRKRRTILGKIDQL
jgi:hypothetical protein